MKTIVAATDFSPRAEAALATARQLAELLKADRVHLVHVLDTGLGGAALPYAEGAVLNPDLARNQAENKLGTIRLEMKDIDQTWEVRDGEPAYEIARAAEEAGAEYIVVATQGRGAIGRAVMGSVTSNIIGYAHCPVVVCGKNRGTMDRLQNILCSVDLSPVSGPVLRTGRRIARDTGGSMSAISIFPRPFAVPADFPMSPSSAVMVEEIAQQTDHQQKLDALIAHVCPEENIETNVMSAAEPVDRIVSYVQENKPHLVVIGSSGIGTWGRRIFGSHAERLAAQVPATVVVVPDPLRRGVGVEAHLLKQELGEKRHQDEQIVYALLEDEVAVRKAVSALSDAGIETDDITVLMSKDTHDDFGTDHSEEGFVAGGTLGASVGGVLGGLSAMGTAAGIGLMVVGPAVALGLGGGLLATLLGYGVPSHEAERVERAVGGGQTLVGVQSRSYDTLQKAKEVLAAQGSSPKRMAL
jgi:nucleotide-binding universal stress UspA family protein